MTVLQAQTQAVVGKYKPLVPYLQTLQTALAGCDIFATFDDLANMLVRDREDHDTILHFASQEAVADAFWHAHLASVPDSMQVKPDEYNYMCIFVQQPYWTALLFSKLALRPPPCPVTEKRTSLPTIAALKRRFHLGYALMLFPSAVITDPIIRKQACMCLIRCCFRQVILSPTALKALHDYVQFLFLSQKAWTYQASAYDLVKMMLKLKLPGVSQSLFSRYIGLALETAASHPVNTVRMAAMEMLETCVFSFPAGIAGRLAEIRDCIRPLITDKDPSLYMLALRIWPLLFRSVSDATSGAFLDYLRDEIDTIKRGSTQVQADPLLKHLTQDELTRVVVADINAMGVFRSVSLAPAIVRDLLVIVRNTNRYVREAAVSAVLGQSRLLTDVHKNAVMWILLSLFCDPCDNVRRCYMEKTTGTPDPLETACKAYSPHPDDAFVLDIFELDQVLSETAMLSVAQRNLADCLPHNALPISSDIDTIMSEVSSFRPTLIAKELLLRFKDMAARFKGEIPEQFTNEVLYYLQSYDTVHLITPVSYLVISEFVCLHEKLSAEVLDLLVSGIDVDLTQDKRPLFEAALLSIRNISEFSSTAFQAVLQKLMASDTVTDGSIIALSHMSDLVLSAAANKVVPLLDRYMPLVASNKQSVLRRVWAANTCYPKPVKVTVKRTNKTGKLFVALCNAVSKAFPSLEEHDSSDLVLFAPAYGQQKRTKIFFLHPAGLDELIRKHNISESNPVEVELDTEEETVSPTSNSSSNSREVLSSRDAWTITYRDPLGARTHFREALASMAQEWDSQDHYFAGTVLIQSSGIGKSRMCTSLAETGVYVVYISFQTGATGYPPRSSIANELVQTRCFREYIYACLAAVAYCRSRGVSAQQFLQLHDPSREDGDAAFWKAITTMVSQRDAFPPEFAKEPIHPAIASCFRERWRVAVADDPKVFRDGDIVTDIGVATQAEQQAEQPAEQQTDRLANHRDGLGAGTKKATHVPPDTASLSAFTTLRRALAYIPMRSGIFSVLLGTTSRIAELAPPAELESFMRRISGGHMLFPPVYLLGTIDTHAVDTTGRTLEEAFHPDILFSYGRPLWYAELEHLKAYGVCKLACGKLVGGSRRPLNEFEYLDPAMPETFRTFLLKLNVLQLLSILRSRVVFNVCRPEYSAELVAGYMWTCTYLAPDRRFLLSSMPSEPVLAEAGAHWMANMAMRTEVVRALGGRSDTNSVDVGQRGEIVAQLLLIFAHDACALQTRVIPTNDWVRPYMSAPFTLAAFLRQLVGCRVLEQLRLRSREMAARNKLPDLVDKGMLAFTHFGYVNEPLQRKHLLPLFRRGAAVCCMQGQTGVDLLLIVLLPDADGQYRVCEENLSYVLVQVKNYKNTTRCTDFVMAATAHLSAAAVGIEDLPRHTYLSLLMSLGGRDVTKPYGRRRDQRHAD
ncbi:hypothetical protein RI367_007664 [Sorochytrium milnesiophthora]